MKFLWMNAMRALGWRRRPAVLPWLLSLLLLVISAAPGWAAVRQTATGPVSIEEVAGNLDTPLGDCVPAGRGVSCYRARRLAFSF